MIPVTSFALFNTLGRIDPSRPFALLGMQPPAGAYFQIESPEFQNPKGSELVLQIQWNSLPASFDFAKYYGAYGVPIDASSFRLAASSKEGGQWHPLTLRDPALFRRTDEGWTSRLEWRAPAADAFKLELIAPTFGFGAALYVNVLSEAALKGTPIPNPPLTPVAAGISVFYQSTPETP